MVIPSGTVYLSDINVELGYAFNNPIFLNNGDVRQLAFGSAEFYNVTPVYNTAIYMSQFRGKNVGSNFTRAYGPGTHTFITPLHATLTVDVYGGGGGGGGGASDIIWYNQAGNQRSSTRFGSGGGAGGQSSFGGILIGNGGGGGAGGNGSNTFDSTPGTAGTGSGGNASNGAAGNGGVGGSSNRGDGGNPGGAGGRSWYTWTRGTFYGVGTPITITVGGGGAGGSPGDDGGPYSGASYLDRYSPGSPGAAGGGGAVYISWT